MGVPPDAPISLDYAAGPTARRSVPLWFLWTLIILPPVFFGHGGHIEPDNPLLLRESIVPGIGWALALFLAVSSLRTSRPLRRLGLILISVISALGVVGSSVQVITAVWAPSNTHLARW